MIYICEDCGFFFCRAGQIDECPSCEKSHIRPATAEEIRDLWMHLEQGL